MPLYTLTFINTTGDLKCQHDQIKDILTEDITMKYNTSTGFKVIACILATVAIIEFVIGLNMVGVI